MRQLTRSFQIFCFLSVFVDQDTRDDNKRVTDAVDGQMKQP